MNPYLEKAASIAALIQEASKDPELGEFILKKKVSKAVPLLLDGEEVGFSIPRKESDGRWRSGPIYVTPEHRGKGVSKAFLLEFFKDKAGRSYISETNTPSVKAFEHAGFSRSGKILKDGPDNLHEYLKD